MEERKSSFLWGTATSEYQISGASLCEPSNWSRWERDRYPEKQWSGKACMGWQRMQDGTILSTLKQLQLNAYRFSVDWTMIEPYEPQHPTECILDVYERFCISLRENGIEPMITLHHFVHPLWFERLGGFEHEENLVHFQNFCLVVFLKLARHVKYWCVINEPSVYAIQGYLRGVFPPGVHSIRRTCKVLRNLMKVHDLVYTQLKQTPLGYQCEIGFIQAFLEFEPYRAYNPIDQGVCSFFSYLFHGLVWKFLKTCVFRPFGILSSFSTSLHYENNHKCFDFLGLNYYSKPILDTLRGKAVARKGQVITDFHYHIDPVGFHNALVKTKDLQVPVYVTENGCADRKDSFRSLWISEYTNSMLDARDQKGVDVRGYFYWTLYDNYEWDEGYRMKFGLFFGSKVQMYHGSQTYIDMIVNNRSL